MQVIHEFVDTEGRTQFDEFDTDIPFDMGDIPQTAHVLLVLRSNARRIAELWKECDNSRGQRKLYVCCPYPGLPKMGKWEDAKLRVREMGFDNPDSVRGGIRAARETDYVNARMVAIAHDMHVDATRRFDEVPEERRNDYQVRKSVLQAIAKSNAAEVINTASAHPLWRRLSWIENFPPHLFLNLVGSLVDPTWYVHPDEPRRIGLFKERCGLYNPFESANGESPYADVFLCLIAPFQAFFKKTREIKLDDLNAPGYFFVRYALRWMQYYANNGEDEGNAFFGAVWRYASKLASYVWLSWMETTHSSVPVNLDENRFFFGDKTVVQASYRAAVS